MSNRACEATGAAVARPHIVRQPLTATAGAAAPAGGSGVCPNCAEVVSYAEQAESGRGGGRHGTAPAAGRPSPPGDDQAGSAPDPRAGPNQGLDGRPDPG